MRAVVTTAHGDPSVLRVEERPDPAPREGDVVVEVRAAGLNFADVMARMGMYPDAPKPPMVMGYEVAGEIAGTGERVMAGTRFGGQAERVVVRREDTIPLPDALSFAQGAAIPVNYATAWAGLMSYGNLQPGERVLIHAAAGGVGMAATQVAKRRGAYVIGTASPSKHDAIRGNGVDEAYGYDLPKQLAKVDLVMDAIGGASFKRSYDLLRPGGRLVAFGASSVVGGEKRNLVKAAPQALRMLRGFNLLEQMSASKAVIGLNMLTLWDDRGTLEPWVTPLREMLEDGSLKPIVSDEVPFDRAAEAHRILTERRNVGKVVLVP
jgi:NADPH:quinone reductase-like Zn-dependent oxidoreductase